MAHLKDKKILVTSGPTHEYLDDIRFISNKSSGKQGVEIAKCLQEYHADVTLVVGPVSIDLSSVENIIRVESAIEMNDAVITNGPFDIAICAAAVGDWRPQTKYKNKIKKTSGTTPLELNLIENPDILKNISTFKDRPSLVIGFAAETENLLENARSKLINKKCDWIIANYVNLLSGNMGGDENEVFIVKTNHEVYIKKQSKKNIAKLICKEIVNEMT